MAQSPSSGVAARLRARVEERVATTLNGVLQRVGLHVQIEPLPPSAAPARPAAARSAPPPGPTPVQVMSAVQNAVVGAVNVVSAVGAGVGAARDAARAASKSASGAADVASGVATVAAGFFPKLAALRPAPRVPRNRPGMPPQRRVADIIKNPMGRSAAPKADEDPAAPPRPVRRVQRIPMVRPKSSLALGRMDQARKPRSYDDLKMRPQLGLTPHEILLKVATLTLGKTLIGLLESGARSQQKALQRVNDRMSQRQVMLLSMLPAQFVVQRLPQHEPAPAVPVAAPAPKDPPPSASGPAGSSGGAFKLRY